MKLFISHADPDQLIARPFADLLQTFVEGTCVFCSSDKGAIENGEFFIQFILDELNTSDGTVSLLSPNYLMSPFCIAERGSALVAKYQRKAIFNSFIIPPTRFRDLQGMLSGVQSEPLDEIASLDLLCTRLGGNRADANWQAARDAFLLEVVSQPS